MAREIRFIVTEEDYIAARLDSLRRFWRSRSGLVLVLTTLGLSAALGAGGAVVDGRSPLGDALGQTIAAAVFLAVAAAAAPLLTRLTSRRLYRKTEGRGEAATFSWSEEGLTSSWASGCETLRWTEVKAWAAARQNFLFYAGGRKLWFLPYRFLAIEQREDVHALAAAAGIRPW